jgi:hypothetical protein
MRYPSLIIGLLVACLFIMNQDEVPRRILLIPKQGVNGGEGNNCRWVTWKKKLECGDIAINTNRPANHQAKPTISSKLSMVDVPRHMPNNGTHAHFKVETTSQPKPVGYAWRVAVLYHGHYDRRSDSLDQFMLFIYI